MTKIYCKDKEGNLRCVEAGTQDAALYTDGQQSLRSLLKDVNITPAQKSFVGVVLDGGLTSPEQKSVKLTREMEMLLLSDAVDYHEELLDFLGTKVDNLEQLIEEFNNKSQEE
jgi:hypothetical protein